MSLEANPEAPEGLWVKWDWPIIWWDWSFFSSSRRMSLILISAISLVLLSKLANFSDTYFEKWHWVTPSWAFEGSLRTCIQVDMSLVLLDSRHRFATSWDVLEDFRQQTVASSFSTSGLASSLNQYLANCLFFFPLASWVQETADCPSRSSLTCSCHSKPVLTFCCWSSWIVLLRVGFWGRIFWPDAIKIYLQLVFKLFIGPHCLFSLTWYSLQNTFHRHGLSSSSSIKLSSH